MEEHHKKGFCVGVNIGVWASGKAGTNYEEHQAVSSDVKHGACRPYPKHETAY
jgi:hypothetical protein